MISIHENASNISSAEWRPFCAKGDQWKTHRSSNVDIIVNQPMLTVDKSILYPPHDWYRHPPVLRDHRAVPWPNVGPDGIE